jgi:hypothetical protein
MLQKKATSYLNAVLDQEGPARTSWCSKWAVHGKASRPACKASPSRTCRRKNGYRTAEVVGNSGSAGAGLTNCDNNMLVLI